MIVIHGLTFLSIAAVIASAQETDVPADESLVERAGISPPARVESLMDAPSNETFVEQADVPLTNRKESFYEMISDRIFWGWGHKRRHRPRRNRYCARLYHHIHYRGWVYNVGETNKGHLHGHKNDHVSSVKVTPGCVFRAYRHYNLGHLMFTTRKNKPNLVHGGHNDHMSSFTCKCGGKKPKKNPCQRNPCRNGGKCRRRGRGYTCTCKSGFSGRRCQTKGPCQRNPCRNGGKCRRRGRGYTCTCKIGFRGKRCQRKAENPCRRNPCRNGGRCRSKGRGYTCSCKIGFRGRRCQRKVLGKHSNGDVKLETDGTPLIYWGNQWVPICGHFFWDNQEGAKLFCKKLGYESGRFSGRGSGKKYSRASFRIGKCNAGDKWERCSGGCNDYQKGGACRNWRPAKCDRNQRVKITIKCSGREDRPRKEHETCGNFRWRRVPFQNRLSMPIRSAGKCEPGLECVKTTKSYGFGHCKKKNVVGPATVKNVYCKPSRKTNWKSLPKATQECKKNSRCGMVYDYCGKGKNFRYCSASASIVKSKCGSVLHNFGDVCRDNRKFCSEIDGGDCCSSYLKENCPMSCSVCKPPVVVKCEGGPKHDIGFALDASGSVGLKNWQIAQKFTNKLAQAANISPQGGRASVVVFSGKRSAKVKISFSRHTSSHVEFAKAVDRLRYTRGGTCIGSSAGALRVSLDQMFRSSNGMRPNSGPNGTKKIFVLFTDGRDYCSTRNYSRVKAECKKRGIKIIVVGVGKADKKKLRKLVHDEKDLFIGKSFKDLNDDFAKNVGKEICNG